MSAAPASPVRPKISTYTGANGSGGVAGAPVDPQSDPQPVDPVLPGFEAVPEERAPASHPGPVPRSMALVEREITEQEETVDTRILLADEARADGRWDDCLKWLSDAQSAAYARKKLVDELRVAKRMAENHD